MCVGGRMCSRTHTSLVGKIVWMCHLWVEIIDYKCKSERGMPEISISEVVQLLEARRSGYVAKVG